LIWLEDFKNPIFKAERIGLNGKKFNCYKFRSMSVSNDKNENVGITNLSKVKERVTKVGKVIRSYRIDEFPQVFNIIKGDMSFVGPRPQSEKYTLIYPEEYKKILSVRPGITGLCTIKFYFTEEKMIKKAKDPEKVYIEKILPMKFKYNFFYVEHKGMILDLKIIAWTIIDVVYYKFIRKILKIDVK
jgi:lipopolysaccharide/colanic/teichoic acid biosynthesis glycosyltransferase